MFLFLAEVPNMMLVLFAFAAVAFGKNPSFFESDPLLRKAGLLSTGNLLSKGNANDWVLQSYAIPHEPMRRLLLLAKRVAGKYDSKIEWHRKAFFNFWNLIVVKFVHGHHQAEETVFFPAVEAKTGKELPPSMTTDHHTLIELLEEIAPLEHQQDQSTLKQKIDHLVDLVIPHLNEEEDSLLPLISQNFTHAEIEVLSQKIVDSFSASQLFWELPPIYLFMESWCVDPACNYRKLETEFREKIPAVIFFLASWTTIPRFIDALESVMGIETGVNKPYSALPRAHELALLLGLALVVYVIAALARKCCKSKKAKTQ